MYLLFYGSEQLLLRRAVSKLKQRFLTTDPTGSNLLELDAETFEVGSFQNTVRSAPFLAKHRFVVVDDVFEFKKSVQAELLEFLRGCTTSNVALFVGGVPDKRSALYKFFQKEAQCQEFSLLQGSALQSWAEKRAAELGVLFEPSALQLLLSSCGSDLSRIDQELQKCASYSRDTALGVADVEKLVVTDYFSSIFDALDALSARRGGDALRLLHEQVQQGQHPLYLLSMLTTQFRQLLILSDCLARGDDIAQTAKKAGIHPFVVQKLRPNVRRYPPALLRSMYMKLVALDEATKTGEISPQVAVDLFVSLLGK